MMDIVVPAFFSASFLLQDCFIPNLRLNETNSFGITSASFMTAPVRTALEKTLPPPALEAELEARPFDELKEDDLLAPPQDTSAPPPYPAPSPESHFNWWTEV